jgi:hypothetical protein
MSSNWSAKARPSQCRQISCFYSCVRYIAFIRCPCFYYLVMSDRNEISLSAIGLNIPLLIPIKAIMENWNTFGFFEPASMNISSFPGYHRAYRHVTLSQILLSDGMCHEGRNVTTWKAMCKNFTHFQLTIQIRYNNAQIFDIKSRFVITVLPSIATNTVLGISEANVVGIFVASHAATLNAFSSVYKCAESFPSENIFRR